jgi:hypothetical protein
MDLVGAVLLKSRPRFVCNNNGFKVMSFSCYFA